MIYLNSYKTFEDFKFKSYENDSIEKFIESVIDLYNSISNLSHLWNLDYNFDLDLNDYLSPIEWIDMSLDELRLYDWIEELKNHYKVSSPLSIINYTNTKGKQPSEYLRVVYICMKNIENNAENIVSIFNRLKERESLPMNEYPFKVPVNELHESVKEWVKFSGKKMSPIIMSKEVYKLLSDINDSDIKLNK